MGVVEIDEERDEVVEDDERYHYAGDDPHHPTPEPVGRRRERYSENERDELVHREGESLPRAAIRSKHHHARPPYPEQVVEGAAVRRALETIQQPTPATFRGVGVGRQRPPDPVDRRVRSEAVMYPVVSVGPQPVHVHRGEHGHRAEDLRRPRGTEQRAMRGVVGPHEHERDGCALARRPPRSPGRDYWPCRAQDDDQRAQLRGARVHGGLRGRTVAAVGECDRRTGELHGRGPTGPRVHQPRGQAVPAWRPPGDPGGPPTWVAPPRKSSASGRAADLRQSVRLRDVLLPHAHELLQQRSGPYFYLPKLRATSRHGCGTMSSTSRSTRSDSRGGRSAPPC